jgi:hypothetical protein
MLLWLGVVHNDERWTAGGRVLEAPRLSSSGAEGQGNHLVINRIEYIYEGFNSKAFDRTKIRRSDTNPTLPVHLLSLLKFIHHVAAAASPVTVQVGGQSSGR